MTLLWGGHIECIKCGANYAPLNYQCLEWQRYGCCPAQSGYQERLKMEAKMPRFNEGRALLLWAWNCQSRQILTDKFLCAKFLKNLARVVGMTVIDGPHIKQFQPPPERPTDIGISVLLTIEESHLAIHTFPEQSGGAAQVTIISCKDFQPVTAKGWIVNMLGARNCHDECLGGSRGFFNVPDE